MYIAYKRHIPKNQFHDLTYRTYNFPQNRVTDHRIGLTLQKLGTILAGKMDEVIDALVLYYQTQKLEELNK